MPFNEEKGVVKKEVGNHDINRESMLIGLEHQSLFQIVMAVGNGMDLHAMLQCSLSVMMRKLGCNTGAVVQCNNDVMEIVHCIPYNIRNSPEEILSVCRTATEIHLASTLLFQIETSEHTLMAFALPSYGVLILGKAGSPFPTRILGALTQIADKLATACIACEQAKSIKDAQQQAQLLLDSAAEGIYGIDSQGSCTFVNQAALRILGYQNTNELIGKYLHGLIHHSYADGTPYPAEKSPFHQSLLSHERMHGDGDVFWHRDGRAFPVEYWLYPIIHDNEVSGTIVTFFDITERKAKDDEIKHLAFYDLLTNLPNRRLLIDRLKVEFASSKRNGQKSALLFIDLDDFKNLNDTLGHDIGDLLLQQVAHRLQICVREGDTVARLGGDEFVIVLKDLSKKDIDAARKTKTISEKILTSLSQSYQLDTHEYSCTASIGATLLKDHELTIDILLKQADIAMYEAKKAGRNTLRFFDQPMMDIINTHAALESELHKALESHQFHLYYQIQVDDSDRPLGAEALIRWKSPERGLVSPALFIPLAEESNLILHIGKWVLESACARLKAWQQSSLTHDLPISVNISVKQFLQADFVTQVQSLIKRYTINPKRLKLEITESLLLENMIDSITKMNALKEIGVQFSLDDFGTGYSSLQYLKQLPLNQLKIDQSFIRDLANDNNDKTIVRTIIAMAHNMNLNVIAEGVETEDQRQILIDFGCTSYQGYLFSKPLPIEQFEGLVGYLHSNKHPKNSIT